jgi:hypothetical protein
MVPVDIGTPCATFLPAEGFEIQNLVLVRDRGDDSWNLSHVDGSLEHAVDRRRASDVQRRQARRPHGVADEQQHRQKRASTTHGSPPPTKFSR